MKLLCVVSATALVFGGAALASEVTVAVQADPETEVAIYEFENGTVPAFSDWEDQFGMTSSDEIVDPELEVVEPDQSLPPDFEPDALFHIFIDDETGARRVVPAGTD